MKKEVLAIFDPEFKLMGAVHLDGQFRFEAKGAILGNEIGDILVALSKIEAGKGVESREDFGPDGPTAEITPAGLGGSKLLEALHKSLKAKGLRTKIVSENILPLLTDISDTMTGAQRISIIGEVANLPLEITPEEVTAARELIFEARKLVRE